MAGGLRTQNPSRQADKLKRIHRSLHKSLLLHADGFSSNLEVSGLLNFKILFEPTKLRPTGSNIGCAIYVAFMWRCLVQKTIFVLTCITL